MPRKPAAPKQRIAPPTILEAAEDPRIWRPWFKSHKSWAPWFAFLRTVFGLELDEAELKTFRDCTGRATPRPSGYTEATLVCGRRAGKSMILALIASYLSAFRDWTPFLTPGERGHIVVIAADRKQAGGILRYLKALLTIPLLGDLIERETAESLELKNGISIEVLTASFRTVRGRTVVAALCDELAFWRTDEDTANPDRDIIAALKPSMATIPGAIMLKASSPYAQRGVLWEDHRKNFGRDDSDLLVWQAATRVMNPSVPESFIKAETEEDPAGAAAEYGALFRTDIESFVSREVVEAATMTGRFEVPPLPDVNYVAWVDPSGGSADSMTLAIASNESGSIVLHAVREVVPPFSPQSVVAEFCALLKQYGIGFVTGDRYAGMWPREQFASHGISYRVADLTASDVYIAFLPLLNSRRVELLDHQKLRNQLIGLERRTSSGGKDTITHAKGAHDDVCCAVSGACLMALRGSTVPQLIWTSIPWSEAAIARERAADRPSAPPETVQGQLDAMMANRRGGLELLGPDYFQKGYWN
jgi:hypothetical protein